MTSQETPLMKELQIAASRMGSRLFRQNSGMGWIGKARVFRTRLQVWVNPGDVLIPKARPFHAGFDGLSDLGGWTPVIITPEMVGQTVAIYTQAEVKDKGRATEAQLRWVDAVNRAGGIAGVVRSEVELRALLAAKSGSTE